MQRFRNIQYAQEWRKLTYKDHLSLLPLQPSSSGTLRVVPGMIRNRNTGVEFQISALHGRPLSKYPTTADWEIYT